MEPSCVRQTLIPGTSAIFGDYLYQYQKVNSFFPHWFGDPDQLKRAAAAIQYPADRRAALAAALRAQNGDSAALRRLSEPNTVAVLTGQQVGLFSGPAYTVFKALTAAKLAESLNAQGIPAVPVFWLATEDHDLAEVDHAWVFDEVATARKLSISAAATGGPVGETVLQDVPIAQLRAALGGLPFANDVADQVAAAYRPGVTLGYAFRNLIEGILKDFGLLYLDPLQPAIRDIVNPFLQTAAQRIPALVPALRARNKELEAAGYHAQVNIESDSGLLFILENGKRLPLRLKDGRFSLKGDKPVDIANAVLSPNALLRPVMQDYLLPTISYVGGPAEVAYMAQAEVLYSALLGRMPVIYPRNGFTLLDARAEKILGKYGVHVPELLGGEEKVKALFASKLVPVALMDEIARLRGTVEMSLQRAQASLRSFDPTLEASAEKSAAKMLYQVDKLSRKTARETFQKNERAGRDASYLQNLIYPHQHLQERFYSILPFLAQAGLDLPKRLWDHTQLSCPDHMVRVV